jgi:uncharacterized membrane protein
MKRRVSRLLLATLLALICLPFLAEPAFAGRSGGSFGGRSGFRSSGGSRSYSSSPRGYGGYNRGPSVYVLPGFGWGGGYGYGGGGMGLFGTLAMVTVLGLGAVMVMKAVRNARGGQGLGAWSDEGEDGDFAPQRAYVYKVQLGLGRSARSIQERLSRYASEGDTGTQTGLAQLLGQTALELMREKASIRYGAAEASGPMNLTNAETKMNAASLTERSRFQVERVRGADGTVRRAQGEQTVSEEPLEYLMVTLVVATRAPLPGSDKLQDREQLETFLQTLGGVAPQALLGLEVIWTPADPNDALTETDLMTTYPHLRSL